jgi:hypothetical protein
MLLLNLPKPQHSWFTILMNEQDMPLLRELVGVTYNIQRVND